MSATLSIILDNVRFAYGPGAAFAFDTEVPAGSLTAVMGPSGSGKSTLFALLAGFEHPDAGHIRIGQADVTDRPPGERPLSIVFQDNNLFTHLDVATNVGLGIAPNRRLSAQERAQVDEALARVGLTGYATRLPASLSGGERQRVALARALIRDRPVLLLDEPFAALGPGLRHDMLTLVAELHLERNLTTLMISHQPADAHAVCDRLIFIDGGHIVENASVTRFLGGGTVSGWADYLGRRSHK